jgi:hypothetical protein
MESAELQIGSFVLDDNPSVEVRMQRYTMDYASRAQNLKDARAELSKIGT